MSYYGKRFPEKNDKVVVTITNESENGFYCKLKEYEDMEGFILSTEIYASKHDKRNIFKHNELYPVLVLNVNEDKNTVDLSYRKIKPDERKKIIENFIHIDKLYNLALYASTFLNLDKQLVFEYTIWNLFSHEHNKHDSLSTYNRILEHPHTFISSSLPDQYKEQFSKFIEYLKSKIIKTDCVVSKEITLIVYDNNGINILKNILTFEEKINNVTYEIKYISSPKYEIRVIGDKENCINAIELISKEITKNSQNYEMMLDISEYKIIKDQNYILMIK